MKVKTTTNYSQFNKLVGNRPENEAHIKKLMQSFEVNPLPTMIVVDKQMNVLDGQHRLEAMKRLGLPVPYAIADADIEDVKRVNNAQRQWNIQDVIKSHAATGNQNYIDLIKDMKELNVSITIAVSASGQDFQKIRSGKLNYISTEKQRQAIIHTNEITGFIGNRQRTSAEATALLTTHPNYNHKRAKKNFARFQGTDKLSPRVNKKAYLLMLEEIYNYDARSKKNEIRLI